MTDAMGTCTIFKSISLNTTGPDSLKYALCFKSTQDWNAFGNPDKNGFYWWVLYWWFGATGCCVTSGGQPAP